ncbi:hypothetical protein WFA24289_00282 [Periweissella fabaria]|uniref:Uncharacterized protein n=1 Tax=Periweissella fabaria TaxID=546157 RepID=A0ABM8Z3R7_9LACO|nr:hypothetical protein WFA24289_00282 [Periweissella fabaria]
MMLIFDSNAHKKAATPGWVAAFFLVNYSLALTLVIAVN